MDEAFTLTMVFLDYYEPSDVVNHVVVLCKLRHLRFSNQMSQRVKQFLTGRGMYVAVCGWSSGEGHVISGITLGSVLGLQIFRHTSM